MYRVLLSASVSQEHHSMYSSFTLRLVQTLLFIRKEKRREVTNEQYDLPSLYPDADRIGFGPEFNSSGRIQIRSTTHDDRIFHVGSFCTTYWDFLPDSRRRE